MNPTATVAAPLLDARAAATPRAVWVSLASVTSILVGAYWDISWHMSVGRDSFWTPAHLAIQLGGVLAALAAAVSIFSTTFGRDPQRRAATVGVWGFRGPLGAFLCAWGGVAMAASAPFDNWWHEAYGLDVKILSPPHMVLNLGILGVTFGGLLQILSALNRAGPEARPRLERVLLFVGGEMLVLNLTAVWERTYRVELHTAQAYVATAVVAPWLLLALARVANDRWAATRVAAIYTALELVGLWVMPLFSAEPKLGPVYQPITHFVPLEFPLLVVVPALALDLLRARIARWPRWSQALALGPAFVAAFFAVQWPFADFLMTGASRNRLFGTHYLPYFIPPSFHVVRSELVAEPLSTLAVGLCIAVAAAVFSSALGLYAGDALRTVRR